jgi:putative exporter of polyketide antibiotics
VPFVPVERTDAVPLVVLAVLAVAATLTGQAGLRRRDLGR